MQMVTQQLYQRDAARRCDQLQRQRGRQHAAPKLDACRRSGPVALQAALFAAHQRRGIPEGG